MSSINKLIEVVRQDKDSKRGDVRGLSLSHWLRYIQFLEIILVRYRQVNDSYVKFSNELLESIKNKSDKNGQAAFDAELSAIQSNITSLTPQLHLEIESFYVFAKIFLDRVADTFGCWFGIKWKIGSSFTQFSKQLSALINKLGLTLAPGDLVVRTEYLQKAITSYRNEEIDHLTEPRKIKGTTWSKDGRTMISSNIMYPTEAEIRDISKIQKNTQDIEVLLKELKKYMDDMAMFFSSNSGVSGH